MPDAGNGQAIFQVHLSGMIAENERRLQRQAWQEGRGASFIIAMRSITKRLKNDPRAFGEPLYSLPALRLQIRHAAIGPVLIDYAVHDHLPLVFIKGVSLLPHKKP
jgi:hypothetical protein